MPNKKTLETSPNFKKIVTGFVLIAVVLLIFILYFSFSKAVIVLNIDDEQKKMNLDITVSATSTLSDLVGEVKYQEMEITKGFEVSKYREEEGMASGKIKIVNNNQSSQTLIATTRFLTPSGLLFRLSKTVNVPAGGSIEAEVKADKKGTTYDIEPTKFTIPGLSESLQEKIYGESLVKMTGGIKKIGVLTEQDVNGAWESFSAELNSQVKAKMNLELKTDEMFLIRAKTLGQKVSDEIGNEVDKFSLIAKVGVESVKINKEDMINIAQKKYREKLSDKIQILSWNLDDMLSKIKEFDNNNLKSILEIELTAEVQGGFDLTKFNKNEIAGFDKKGVEYYFSQYPSIQKVDVKFSPFWVKSVPAVSDRIEIEVK